MTLEEKYQKVLRALADTRSRPFLQLASLCGIGREELTSIISHLENYGMVTVTDRDNVVEEIVTLKDKGYALASLGG